MNATTGTQIKIGPELYKISRYGSYYGIAGSQLDPALTDQLKGDNSHVLCDVAQFRGCTWADIQAGLTGFIPEPEVDNAMILPGMPPEKGERVVYLPGDRRFVYHVKAFLLSDRIRQDEQGETIGRVYERTSDLALQDPNTHIVINSALPEPIVAEVQRVTQFPEEEVIHSLVDLAGMTLQDIIKKFHFVLNQKKGIYQIGDDISSSGAGMHLASFSGEPGNLTAYAHGFKAQLIINSKEIVDPSESYPPKAISVATGETDYYSLRVID